MASESDGNSFARRSAWPRLPQKPLRVRSLTSDEPPSSVESAAPLAADDGLTPAFEATLQPNVGVQRETIVAPEAWFSAPGIQRNPGPRRSWLPAAGATLLGGIGLLGLAVVLGRGQPVPALTPLAVPTARASLPAEVPGARVAPAPANAPVGTRMSPELLIALPRVRLLPKRDSLIPIQAESAASAATSEILGAPVLSLSQIAPVDSIPTPPRIDDPSVPVVSRAPNS